MADSRGHGANRAAGAGVYVQRSSEKLRFPALIEQVAEPSPNVFNLLLMIVMSALFYDICFYVSPKKIKA